MHADKDTDVCCGSTLAVAGREVANLLVNIGQNLAGKDYMHSSGVSVMERISSLPSPMRSALFHIAHI